MPATPEKMMELANQLAQAANGEEVMSLLEEAGYELAATEAMGEEPLTMDMEETGEVEEEAEADEAGADMMEDMMEDMPMPMPMPKDGPKLNIVAARFRAADNALKKGKKSNGRR
tara:strand:+ start:3439 stop:3783 length:345 start_codon:yes stop_codon:yes gene_type:complete